MDQSWQLLPEGVDRLTKGRLTKLQSLCLHTPPCTGLSCCPSQGLPKMASSGKCEQSVAVCPSPNHAATAGLACRAGERRHSLLQLGSLLEQLSIWPRTARGLVGKKTKHGCASICSREQEKQCAHFLILGLRGRPQPGKQDYCYA